MSLERWHLVHVDISDELGKVAPGTCGNLKYVFKKWLPVHLDNSEALRNP